MYISSRSEKYFAKSVKSTSRSRKQQSTLSTPFTCCKGINHRIHMKTAPQNFAQRGFIMAFYCLPSALRKNIHGVTAS